MNEQPEIEYRARVKLDWCQSLRELHAPDGGWRDRQHVCKAAASVSDRYMVHRRVKGGEWQLVVQAT